MKEVMESPSKPFGLTIMYNGMGCYGTLQHRTTGKVGASVSSQNSFLGLSEGCSGYHT